MKVLHTYQKPVLKPMGKLAKLTLAMGSAGGDSNSKKNGMGT